MVTYQQEGILRHLDVGVPVQQKSRDPVSNGSVCLVAGCDTECVVPICICKIYQCHEFASIAIIHLNAPFRNFPAGVMEQGCVHFKTDTATTHAPA